MAATVLELCEINPSDLATESFPFGEQHVHRWKHRPTGASASERVAAGEPLTDSVRDAILQQLAIEILSRTMTAEKWDRCPDVRPMLKFLEKRAGRRKLRLFGCAMARLSVHLLVGLDGPALLREAEDAADRGGNERGIVLPIEQLQAYAARNSIDSRGREAQRGEVEASHMLQRCRGDVAPYHQSEWLGAWHNAMFAREPFLWMEPNAQTGGPSDQVAALRDIFGNPFRSPAFAPAWRSPTAVELARQVLEHRRPDAIAVLADALQVAGCHDSAILEHCREESLHLRGCWVLDLVLGME